MKRDDINIETEKGLSVDLDMLTSDQKDAVLQQGNIIVSAAAGSGKTSTMIKKIVYQIEKGATLKNMLILVYNNAAADELKEKLHKALFETACSANGDEREIFRKELDNLPFAKIGTIHSFCQGMLKENFERLGLSPTFSVIDETSTAVYMQKALDKVFEEHFEKDDKDFETLEAVFSVSRKEDDLRQIIIKIFELMDIQPDKNEFLQNIAACYDNFSNNAFIDTILCDAKEQAELIKNQCEQLLEIFIAENEQKYADNMLILSRFADLILKAENNNEILDIITAGYETVRASKSRKATEFISECVEKAKAIIKFSASYFGEIRKLNVKSETSEIEFKQNREYALKLVDIALEFGAKFEELKSKSDVLSFSDLEHKTVELIKKSDIDEYKFDFVFVDEYQDINPTQEFIISKICKNNAFFVGDVKQSIYGFRMADPTIFLDRWKRYKNGEGTQIDFTKNFRSEQSILNFVNGIFDCIMTEKSADVNYKRDARFTTEKGEVEKNVQLHLFVKSRKERPLESGIYNLKNQETQTNVDEDYAEGLFIANQIKDLVGKALKDDGKFISYGDIAILFRNSNVSTERIVSTLIEQGIPLNEGKFSESDQSGERDLLNFLKVIDNPYQDYALAGYLLSPFGGLNETDLAKVSFYDGTCLYDKIKQKAKSVDELGKKLRTLLENLEKYRIKSASKSVADTISGIISDYSYDAYLASLGQKEVASLRLMVQETAKQNYNSLSQFVREFQSINAKKATAKGGDFVQVSTFHGYKGLESPVVFVGNISNSFVKKSQLGDLLADGKGFIGLKYFNFNNKTKSETLSLLALKKRIKIRETKEEMRLLYVALTRAKQYMFISGTVSEKTANEFGKVQKFELPNSNLDFISSAVCKDNYQFPKFIHQENEYALIHSNVNEVPIFEVAGDEEFSKNLKNEMEYVYPYKEATKLSMKYSVSEINQNDERANTTFSDSVGVGTAYHKVMQNMDFEVSDIKGVEAEIKRMYDQNLLDKTEYDAVNAKDILVCLDAEIMQFAKKSKCLREQQFMAYICANEILDGVKTQDKVLVQGVADLIIIGEKNILVDFKNSKLTNEVSLKKYKKQLEIYSLAIEKALKIKLDDACLYSFKTGKTVSIKGL